MIDQASFNNSFKTDAKRIFFRDKAMNRVKQSITSDLWDIARDILDRMPAKPRASQNLRSLNTTHSTSPMLLDQAIDCPWMAFDSEKFRNTLIIDIDHADWFEQWFELDDSIKPHMVIDPWSGRAHAILFLSSPVLTMDGAGYKPQKLADYAGRLLAAYFKGTLLPQGNVVKNPFGLERNMIGTRKKLGQSAEFPEDWEYIQDNGMMWRTIRGVSSVELSRIVKVLSQNYSEECSRVKTKFNRYEKNHRELDDLGRNDRLFKLTSYFARCNYEQDFNVIYAEATKINDSFSNPLPAYEVKSVSRSIAKFMQYKYRPKSNTNDIVKRGRDLKLITGLNTKQSQSIAAQQTNLFQKNGTDQKIWVGLKSLKSSGVKITQKSLALASKLSERTIKNRWKVDWVKDQRLEIAEKTVVSDRSENRQNAVLSGITCSRAESVLPFSLFYLRKNNKNTVSQSSLAAISREHNKTIRLDNNLNRYYNLIREKMDRRASRFIQEPKKVRVYSTRSYESYRKAVKSYQQAILRKHRRDKLERSKRKRTEIRRISRMKPVYRQKAWCRFVDIFEYEWLAKISLSSPDSKARLMQYKDWSFNRIKRIFHQNVWENNLTIQTINE